MKKIFNEWAIPIGVGVSVLAACAMASSKTDGQNSPPAKHRSMDDAVFIAPSNF